MRTKVFYDDDKKTLHAALAGPLSPREQAEFFIKTALVLSGQRKRQLVLFFDENQSALSVPRNLAALFKGFGKLGLAKIALVGVPLPARGIVHGVIESVQSPSRTMQYEFFACEEEAFIWLEKNDRRTDHTPPSPPGPRKEMNRFENTAHCKNAVSSESPVSMKSGTTQPNREEAQTKPSNVQGGIESSMRSSNLDCELRLALKKSTTGTIGNDNV